ncbi:hypothetical protein EDD85DRAFT_790811 [Armillaria nabsnona]|nr:hypothetical protein EDD85DRAFT_790811 [Armillaria nabsnona]
MHSVDFPPGMRTLRVNATYGNEKTRKSQISTSFVRTLPRHSSPLTPSGRSNFAQKWRVFIRGVAHWRHDDEVPSSPATPITTGIDLLLPKGLPWSIRCGASYLLPSTRLLQKLVTYDLVSTGLVKMCKWMSSAAWAHRRRLWIAREKALRTERILGEYAGEATGCVYARIERAEIHVSPFSATKNECGREVRAPTTIHVKGRSVGGIMISDGSKGLPG